jgi:hypothetical protein
MTKEGSMRLRELILMLSAATVVCGCKVVARQEVTKAQLAADRTVPTCQSDAECKAMWDAAQRWVSDHAGYRIETSSDELIATETPLDKTETRLAISVSKEQDSPGVYKILVTIWCGNGNNCDINPAEAAYRFNQAVAAAGSQK